MTMLEESRVIHETPARDFDEENPVVKKDVSLYAETFKVPHFLIYTIIYCSTSDDTLRK